MKLTRILCTLLALSFVSSCALQQGVLDQKADEEATKKKSGGITLQTPQPIAPPASQRDQGSAVAAKMIAPVTQ